MLKLYVIYMKDEIIIWNAQYEIWQWWFENEKVKSEMQMIKWKVNSDTCNVTRKVRKKSLKR